MMFGGILESLTGKTQRKNEGEIRPTNVNRDMVKELPNWGAVDPNAKHKSPKIEKLLSATDGPFKDFDDQHRTCMAVVRDTVHCKKDNDVLLLMSPGQYSTDIMLFAKEMIKHSEFNLVQAFQTTSSVIGVMYEAMMSEQDVKTEDFADEDKWIAEAIHHIMKTAVDNGASDIHITLRGQLNVKYRVDGTMIHPDNNIPYDKGEKFVTGFYNQYISDVSKTNFNPDKTLSASFTYRLDTGDETYTPVRLRYEQAPGIEIDSEKTSIDLVMRVLSVGSNINIRAFQDCGYDMHTVALLNRLTYKAMGIILVVGETGSGKSTSLQSLFNAINENNGNSKKVISIDDTPEGHVPNVNIQPLNLSEAEKSDPEKLEAATMSAVGSAMRQDPDVVGIGEIRFKAVASMAIEAALTGHLVASTLHAARWKQTYTRLIETFKLNAPLICSSGMIQAIIAQKLVKKVCMHCSLKYDEVKAHGYYADMSSIESFIHTNCKQNEHNISDELNEHYKRLGVPENIRNQDFSRLRFINSRPSNDCKHCNGRGVSGRTLAYEVFVPSRHPEVVKLLIEGRYDDANREWLNCEDKKKSLVDGFSLEKRAIDLALQGITCTMETVSLLDKL